MSEDCYLKSTVKEVRSERTDFGLKKPLQLGSRARRKTEDVKAQGQE